MKTLTINVTILLSACMLYAQQTPAPAQQDRIAINGAKAHLGNGAVIENSLIIFENGIIEYVGAMSASLDRSGMEIIDAKGQNVYPGFIIPNSTLGLVEIDALRTLGQLGDIKTVRLHGNVDRVHGQDTAGVVREVHLERAARAGHQVQALICGVSRQVVDLRA